MCSQRRLLTLSGTCCDARLLLCVQQAREASFRSIKTIAECLADEIINASKVGHGAGSQPPPSALAPSCWQPCATTQSVLTRGWRIVRVRFLHHRARPTATRSRRRTRSSASPRPTGKCLVGPAGDGGAQGHAAGFGFCWRLLGTRGVRLDQAARRGDCTQQQCGIGG